MSFVSIQSFRHTITLFRKWSFMLDKMFYLPYFWYIKTDIFVLFLFLDIIEKRELIRPKRKNNVSLYCHTTFIINK